MTDACDDVLEEQIRYYRARAPEYDEWFLRQGRYDRGAEHTARWKSEAHQVEHALKEAHPHGQILELACGTGIWTRHLAPLAEHLTAVDSSPEAIQICQDRINGTNIEYIVTDIFEWSPPSTYDFIFFGFWLSHVPADRFESFWRQLRTMLKPDGRVFFVDNRFKQDSTAKDHTPIDRSGIVERKLNDGRNFSIVKQFYEPETLAHKLEGLGWTTHLQTTNDFFIYGTAQPILSCN